MSVTKRKKRRVTSSSTARSSAASAATVFRAEDYLSDNGMLTDVWGPAQWHVMHTMSFNYPVHPTAEQRKQYRDHFLSLQFVLPCGKCRQNLVKNFQKLPLRMAHMKNRDTFSRYVYELHELVNDMLGKTSGLSFSAVRDRYEEFRARCASASSSTAPPPPPSLTPKKENGCTEPLVGIKQRCMIRIVPKSTVGDTIVIDEACHATKKQKKTK